MFPRLLNIVAFGLLSLIAFPAMGQVKNDDAIKMNDQLAILTDSLQARGLEWGIKFNELCVTRDYKKLTPYRISLQNFIAKKMSVVVHLKDVKGSERLRKTMVDMLLFEQELIEKGMIPLESLNRASTKTEIEAALRNLNEMAKGEPAMLEKFNQAQDEYAWKNGFVIRKAP
jgi:hypothetical protein